MNPEKLAAFRARASNVIAAAFATTIDIGPLAAIPAARWSLAATADYELAGLLPQADIAFRVALENLRGLEIVPQQTTLTEQGRQFRVERIRQATGDPSVVLECKAL